MSTISSTSMATATSLAIAKRESQAFIDVLAAESVGKFPRGNVAEASHRVSGVSISREFGGGESVSVPGTAVNFDRTPRWFASDQPAAARSFNYLTLPI